ncbi:winged helix-turn-helix domain-containing protein [Streptococcus merionis]|uniref:Regulatory protein ArsR n=1 Tax=Streptococcus merionis TaxID=400065 RepID=A0A239SR22_9STRE|nr:winged helix-turn-helix domain-containing protein [Streptococcus merionis]SNU87689.1 regulatory protein ArsR [Streptococcus merionis]
MKWNFDPTENELIEYLTAPEIVKGIKSFKEDLSSREMEIIADALQVADAVRDAFIKAGLQEKILKYHLVYDYMPVSFSLYMKVLSLFPQPKTIAELCQCFLALSKEQILEVYQVHLLNPEEPEQTMEEVIEQSMSLSAENKWYWSQAIKYPEEQVKGLVEVLMKTSEIYRPYYERYRHERETYYKELDIDSVLKEFQIADFLEEESQLYQEIRLLIFSPWLVGLGFIRYANNSSLAYLRLSSRIEKILRNRHQVDNEVLADIMKCLGDKSRYEVLVELYRTQSKNKDIAKKLGITSAAVSFHVQKLNNQLLLTSNKTENGQRFNLNKKLIIDVIAKLNKDFDLNLLEENWSDRFEMR